MTVKERVLALLDDQKGSYLSGESLAAQLSVTRSAVWKAVKALQKDGYEIRAVTNKGYCLANETDVFSAGTVERLLTGPAGRLRLEMHDSMPSTNDRAKALAAQGQPEGAVVLAEAQTQGRGRSGKAFYSPQGTGIYMSILLRPKMSAAQASLLTTAAAVAVAEAIEAVSGRQALIKWVNDVFVEHSKVCGILTEAAMSVESGGLDYAVVGIGINVLPPEGGFPQDLSGIAAAVFTDTLDRGGRCSRLAGAVLNRFMAYYTSLEKKVFLPEYKKRALVLGREITVLGAGGGRQALALDLDDDCRLKIRYENGEEQWLSSGEISIKIAEFPKCSNICS